MALKRGRGTDSVNGKTLYRKSLGSPQLTPQKFRRQLKTVVLRQGVQVDYSFPTALEGDQTFIDLNQTDQAYESAILSTTDEILLTGNDLVSYKRTNDAQTELIHENLVEETDPPPPLSALVTTMDQEALGNGKSLLRLGVVDTVFPNDRWSVNRPITTPEVFRALLPTQSHAFTEAGIAGPIPLPLPAGLTEAFDEQIDVYRHRQSTGSLDIGLLPITIFGSRTTKEKQVEHIEKTLQLSSVTPALPTALLDVTWENLGDGTAVEEHDFVDNLFNAEVFGKTIPDPIPEKFRVIVPTKRHEFLVEDTSANDRNLATGELSYSSERVNAFVVKESSSFRDTTTLPVSLPGYRMTQNQQVADVIATLATGLQTITPNALMIEAEVENLGNNLSLLTKSTLDTVWPDDSFTKSVLNLIPEKLRAAIPIVETSIDTTIPPIIDYNYTLVTGELEHTEKRLAVFKKRVMSKRMGAITLPLSKTDYGVTMENGGNLTQTIYTLNTHGSMGIDLGLTVLKSDIVDLGNGYDVKTTEEGIVPWPMLPGQDYDERLDLVIPFTQQVTPQGSDLGAIRTDIKPKDFWKQEERTIDLSVIASVLDPYVLSYPSKVNIDMPDRLLSVSGIIETAFGEGANEEDGTFDFSGNFSVSMALKASAQSSASMIPDVSPEVVQFWGNNLDSMHYQFFLPQPVTPAQIATKLTALIGSAVSNWPKFSPKTVTIAAKGMRASVQATASSQGSASETTCGTSCPASSSTAAGGTGWSHEKSLNLKTVRISPTIHDLITVGGDPDTTQPISATATAQSDGLGPTETHTEDDEVDASIFPRSIPATAGATTWPTSGLYLYKLDAQPYKYGYVQFHAIIVDAAGFPTA